MNNCFVIYLFDVIRLTTLFTLGFLGAVIFLGAISVVLFLLLVTYCCIKKELCCCQQQSGGDEDEGEPLVDTFDNEDMDVDLGKPYTMPTNEQCEPDEFNYVMTDQSDVQTSDMSGDDLTLPKPHMSVKTYAESIETDSQIDRGEILGKYTKMKKDEFIDGCKLKLSLLYSKNDLFLMLTVNEITGMPNKSAGGYDYIRVSITLLPEKKYRSKTRLQFVDDELVIFGDTFKFSNVSRESLFSSAFRFRLYAKKKVAREICIGEMIVQLADVAQRSGGFVTWKTFERKK